MALRGERESGGREPGLRLAGVLCRFWWVRGHLSEGRGWREALLAQAGSGPPVGAATVRAKALHGVAQLAYRQGDYGRATALYEESLALRRELGDKIGIVDRAIGPE